MGLIIGAALALFSVAILAYPFRRSRLRARDEGTAADARPAAPELDSFYETIRTLRLEHQLGQVPEELYREQLTSYRLQAAAALRRRVEERAGDPSWVLEQEVLVARAALRGVEGVLHRCPNCGAAPGPSGAGCPECGAKLDISEPAP